MRLSELKILYEVLDENRERIEYAIESIKEGLITIDDFENGEWFKYGTRFYGGDEYVQDYYGNVLERDNAFYCQGEDDWFSDEDAVTVYEHRSETTYSRRWAEGNSDLSMYRGDYYDSDALEYHDLVYVQDTGDICSNNNAYYHEEEGNWYSYPDDEETYVRGYHNGSYKSKSFDGKVIGTRMTHTSSTMTINFMAIKRFILKQLLRNLPTHLTTTIRLMSGMKHPTQTY